MVRNTFAVLIILVAAFFSAQWLLTTPADFDSPDSEAGHSMAAVDDYPRGPHGSRLLEDGDFALEITIFEAGIPPEFRIYSYYQNEPVAPGAVDLEIRLHRTGGITDIFDFRAEQDFLRGSAVVTEPHSFDVTVDARYQGSSYQWAYQSYEGRTEIPRGLASEAGIATEIAGPVTVDEVVALNGRVQIDPNRLSQVRPRFPGMVETVHARLGDVVRSGQVLVTVQSNESMQSYDVNAPIGGLITSRNVQVGESTGNEPLFTITDLSEVWVELDVFAGDLSRIAAGQAVIIETLDGYRSEGVIDWISPLAAHASQSVQAIVPLPNTDSRLRTGQFVRGQVKVAAHDVALAVRQSAIQRFRDFQVVFARFGDTYEVRMLELGRNNADWVEVLGGLAPGTEYVTDNSYLIKADIEKAGATHDH